MLLCLFLVGLPVLFLGLLCLGLYFMLRTLRRVLSRALAAVRALALSLHGLMRRRPARPAVRDLPTFRTGATERTARHALH